MKPTEPRRTIRLVFEGADGAREAHHDLSCVAVESGTMFLGGDESAGVERMVRQGDGFARREHVALCDLIDLPDGPDGEMDIEGLAVDEGWLWVLGSQSLKRRQPRAGDGPEAAMDRLATVIWEPNRQFLGRLPLVERDGALAPVARDGERRAAHLRFGGQGALRRWLRGDPHLGPFLDLPSKENGLDVEGIAVRGDRVWLGLRGPLLRRNAVILEMHLRETRDGHLKARRLEGKRRYRKLAFDTRGLGIRDLKRDGDDLLVIVGTVMSGDGPAAIIRLPGLAARDGAGYLGPAEVGEVLPLPERGPRDHPEGMAHLGHGEWLVVYDSPHEDRLGRDPPSVLADVWTVP